MARTAKNRRTLFGAVLGICAALALVIGFGVLVGAGAAASSAKPVNTSPPKIKGTAEEGKVLTKDIGEWTNNPTGYDGFWMRCNKNGGSCSDIKGGNNATYTLTSADVGHTIRLRVEATNADGTTSATSVPTAVIAAATDAPTNTSPPTVSGTPQEGKTLTGKRGKWSGKPNDYNDYWVRCDKNGASCSDINGANKSSYVLTSADVGNTIRFKVGAQNAAGRTFASSVPTAVVSAASRPLPPPAPATGCPNGSGAVNVANISSPARLLIDAQQTSPSVATPGDEPADRPLPRLRLRRALGPGRARLRNRRPLQPADGSGRAADRRQRLGGARLPDARRLPGQLEAAADRDLRPRAQIGREHPRRHLHPPPLLRPRQAERLRHRVRGSRPAAAP